jgi:uncharacterized protein (DUF433 family)
MTNDDLILSDPEIMGGTPCIKGTRITVYAIAARLRGGETVAELIADYPYISVEQVEAAAAYAERVPFEEDPGGRPSRRAKRRADVA